MAFAGQRPCTRASLHFLSRDKLYECEKPYAIQYWPHGDVPVSNVKQFVAPNVPIYDLRPQISKLDLGKDGFEVHRLDSALSKDEFSIPDKVISVYLEEVKRLLCNLTGTTNVAIVEYLIRRRNETFPMANGSEFEYAQPVATAHIDFTPDCIVEMIRDRYAHRAETLLAHRYRLVNVWKPLQGPLRDWPLTLCKASSIDTEYDLQAMDRVYSRNIEESIQVHHNEAQEWCFLRDHEDNEVLIFRTGDSSLGYKGGVPHCSFDLSKTSDGLANPRESIEVRALIFDADEDLDLQSMAPSRRHGPKSTY